MAYLFNSDRAIASVHVIAWNPQYVTAALSPQIVILFAYNLRL